ncbi:hypothetical protein ACQEVX_05420 [Streptomyces syringium]|uniref:hypothetical protein n=1 Tax=Streptomyces syringium TaxID=76729 RepID=UPI003D91E895
MHPEQILAALEEAVRPHPRSTYWGSGAADAAADARALMAGVRLHADPAADLDALTPVLRTWISHSRYLTDAPYPSGYRRIQTEVEQVLNAAPTSIRHYLQALLARGARHLAPEGHTVRWPSTLLLAALSCPSAVVPPIPSETHVHWQARAALAVTSQETQRLSLQLAALQARLDVLTERADRAVRANGSLTTLRALRDALNDRPETDESSR